MYSDLSWTLFKRRNRQSSWKFHTKAWRSLMRWTSNEILRRRLHCFMLNNQHAKPANTPQSLWSFGRRVTRGFPLPWINYSKHCQRERITSGQGINKAYLCTADTCNIFFYQLSAFHIIERMKRWKYRRASTDGFIFLTRNKKIEFCIFFFETSLEISLSWTKLVGRDVQGVFKFELEGSVKEEDWKLNLEGLGVRGNLLD